MSSVCFLLINLAPLCLHITSPSDSLFVERGLAVAGMLLALVMSFDDKRRRRPPTAPASGPVVRLPPRVPRDTRGTPTRPKPPTNGRPESRFASRAERVGEAFRESRSEHTRAAMRGVPRAGHDARRRRQEAQTGLPDVCVRVSR